MDGRCKINCNDVYVRKFERREPMERQKGKGKKVKKTEKREKEKGEEGERENITPYQIWAQPHSLPSSLPPAQFDSIRFKFDNLLERHSSSYSSHDPDLI